jgi:hemolysin activation/secretion protein
MKKIIIMIVCAVLHCTGSNVQAAPPTVQDRNDATTNDLLNSLKQQPTQPFDEREKKLPRIEIEKEKKVDVAVSEEKITFTTFVLKGATLLLKDEVESVVKPFIGEKMSLNQLQRLSGILTKLYITKGYATSYCFIPPQNVEGGKVVFQCVETRVGKLIIKNAEEYNEKLFLRFIRPLRDKPLNINELNERLKSLSLMPTFNATVEIKRTEQIDVVDLQVDLKEKPLSSSEIYLDNFGSRFSGRERVGGIYNIVNPSGYGDVINLHARTSMELDLNHYFSVGYKRLVNSQGGLLSLMYAYNDNEVAAEEAPGNLRINGDFNSIMVNYKHPLLINNKVIVTGNLQYDYKDVTSKTTLITTGDLIFDKEDKTHVFSIGTDVEFVDPLGGWNVLSLSLLRGVEGFFNGMRERDTVWTSTIPIKGTIREGVVPDFTLFTTNYYRRQLFPLGEYKFENILNIYGQYTGDRLPSAYTFADGDYGCHTMVEFRFPVIGDALKVSLAHNFDIYVNSPKTKDLVGLSSESSNSLTAGILGHFDSFNADYYLSYTKGLTGLDANWDDYKHMDKISFFLTKRF